MSIFVDSDILIDVSRGRLTDLLHRWGALGQSDEPILYSPVSVAEVWSGARSEESEKLSNLLSALICVPVTEETGRHAASYLRAYRKSHGLGIADALIAAAASLTGAALWTRNRKHYPMKDLTFY